MADEAQKPKNDQDDYYSPEHRYAFLLSWFKHRIPTSIVKQSSKNSTIKAATSRGTVTDNKSCATDGEIDCSAPFGRNNFSNVFDVLLDFAYLRMHVTNQIVLGPRKLFNAGCHFMEGSV